MSGESTATPEQAQALVGFLQRCFGGFAIEAEVKGAFVRLFGRYAEQHVRDTIEDVSRTQRWLPSPHDLAMALRKRSPAVTDTRTREPWPDTDGDRASRHIAAFREDLRAKGCRV